MSVDPSDPRKLQISNVQPSDAGTYLCFPSRIQWILTIKAFTKANIFKPFPWINKTADQGETVVLHCNGSEDSGEDIFWLKEKNLLFIYSPFINQTVTNYTSSRMSVDPSDPLKLQISNVQPSDAGTYYCSPSRILWILTIKGISVPASHKSTIFIIVRSVGGAVAVGLLIFCAVWIPRKCKKCGGSAQGGTGATV
ncbi:roundabout homolog 2-like isoform X1 [Astyanax mexicanus]|uniref:roundabout homolog 2-like isoform X1 n=2 Tax=Astyanax mexicanus TaxID=7994 RepID=UPI0020CB2240|nr:roundabout homolog 2-like isoform X1 [Astyanax mexicanus]XP_049341286.1 roundabout homolog 2-like isoform X1 [Astyanax mexicanus]